MDLAPLYDILRSCTFMAVLPFPSGLLAGRLWYVLSDVAKLWQEHEPVLQHGGVHAEPEPCAVVSCHICRSALLSFSSEAVFI